MQALTRTVGTYQDMPVEEAISTLRFDQDGEAARREIAGAADALVGRGRENPRLRIVSAADSLSTETISTLITALRKLRGNEGRDRLGRKRVGGADDAQTGVFPAASDQGIGCSGDLTTCRLAVLVEPER